MSDRYKMIPDYRVTARVQILAEVSDYNHRLMNIPAMWKETRGDGAKLVVLDTGVPNHCDILPCGGHSVIAGYKEDLNGHATHVAGIIAAIANNGMGVAGIAPDVEDYYCAVLDKTGSGDIESIIAGIRWAVDEVGADIINMSLGIPASAGKINALEAACEYAVNNGVTIIAAAGNEYGKVGQPAQYDCVISVAAVNDKMEHAAFSNTGREVDFAAGGVNVYSTYLGNSYAKLSGTSMASPALAAVAALIQAKHIKEGNRLDPTELKDHLRKIAYDIGPEGVDDIFGYGIPIFGKDQDNDTPPVPEQPTDRIKKLGPLADCAYWRMWNDFISEVNYGLDKGAGLKDAVELGIRALGTKTELINLALKAKK